MGVQPLQHLHTMRSKFLHPITHFTLDPSSQEPQFLLDSPQYSLIYLYYTRNPKGPDKSASQAHTAARRGTPACMDFTSRTMVRRPSNTLLW